MRPEVTLLVLRLPGFQLGSPHPRPGVTQSHFVLGPAWLLAGLGSWAVFERCSPQGGLGTCAAAACSCLAAKSCLWRCTH